MNYKFDHNWFAQNEQNLTNLFQGYDGTPALNILEIGSFEGRSTVWFLDNVKECNITCIDTWNGGMDHDRNSNDINFKTVKDNFDFNIEQHKDRVRVIQNTSLNGLTLLYTENKKFDFVFIDGSHLAADVLSDLVLSWNLLNVGGLVYCDDYFWGHNKSDPDNAPLFNFVFHTPKLGIDSFINTYGNKIRIVENMNTPAIFVKVSE